MESIDHQVPKVVKIIECPQRRTLGHNQLCEGFRRGNIIAKVLGMYDLQICSYQSPKYIGMLYVIASDANELKLAVDMRRGPQNTPDAVSDGTPPNRQLDQCSPLNHIPQCTHTPIPNLGEGQIE